MDEVKEFTDHECFFCDRSLSLEEYTQDHFLNFQIQNACSGCVENLWRFVAYVNIHENGCWIWNTYESGEKKYGSLMFGKKPLRAHRVSWIIHHGRIPKGLCVCHRCDNPPCVNPDHLYLGTHLDNNRDKTVKGRNVSLAGEESAVSKLTTQDVLSIRLLYERRKHGFGCVALGRRFSVAPCNITSIIQRRTWKHV